MSKKSEFDRLLGGQKPMVVYYKAVGENYHYEDRDKFLKAVSHGRIVINRFYVKNEGQEFRLIYETYATLDNAWRLKVYQNLKKIGQIMWNNELEDIEGLLLGYRGIYASSN